jgi:hypothetical protein
MPTASKTTMRFNGFAEGNATMVIRIVPTIRWMVRTRIALMLIRLATWVIGVGLRVDEEIEVDDGSE